MAINNGPTPSKASLNSRLAVQIGNNQILRAAGEYQTSYRTADNERIEHQEMILQPNETWYSNPAELIASLILSTSGSINVVCSMHDGSNPTVTVNQLLVLDAGVKSCVITNTGTTACRVALNAVVSSIPVNMIKFGIHAQDGTTNAAIIASLLGSSAVKNGPFTVNPGAGQYIYFAYPSSMPDSTFTVNGFTGGFTKVEVALPVGGVTYKLYVSNNSNLGLTQVVVADVPTL